MRGRRLLSGEDPKAASRRDAGGGLKARSEPFRKLRLSLQRLQKSCKSLFNLFQNISNSCPGIETCQWLMSERRGKKTAEGAARRRWSRGRRRSRRFCKRRVNPHEERLSSVIDADRAPESAPRLLGYGLARMDHKRDHNTGSDSQKEESLVSERRQSRIVKTKGAALWACRLARAREGRSLGSSSSMTPGRRRRRLGRIYYRREAGLQIAWQSQECSARLRGRGSISRVGAAGGLHVISTPSHARPPGCPAEGV